MAIVLSGHQPSTGMHHVHTHRGYLLCSLTKNSSPAHRGSAVQSQSIYILVGRCLLCRQHFEAPVGARKVGAGNIRVGCLPSGARQTSDQESAGHLKIASIHSHKEGGPGAPCFNAQKPIFGPPPLILIPSSQW